MHDEYASLAPMYDTYARDPGMQAFYAEWVASLERAISRYHLRPGVLVDLACGTGNSTLAWLKHPDWTIVGVDRSESLLRLARRKSARVRWHRQDMRELDLPLTADLVTCHFDALNHVLDARSLQRVFRNVGRLLNDGGLFQFDMNTVEMLEWVARHEKLFRVGPHYFMGYNEYDRRRLATFHQLWFVARGRLYERREVTVHERGYPAPAIRAMLRKAGLLVVSVRVQRRLGGQPARLLFIARKPRSRRAAVRRAGA